MRGRPSKDPTPRFVVCIDNADYEASLELHKIYTVVHDQDAAQDGDLRIVDESGEDYLYSADREELLRNLSKQTSLNFTREPRLIDYWTLVDEKR